MRQVLKVVEHFIEDLERDVPSLLSTRQSPHWTVNERTDSRLGNTANIDLDTESDTSDLTELSDGEIDDIGALLSTLSFYPATHNVPFAAYRISCLANGYDPDELDLTRSKRRMVRQGDGSEWHPATLRIIEEHVQRPGQTRLPASIAVLIERKMKAGSTFAASLLRAIDDDNLQDDGSSSSDYVD